jgi:hypothetical protein
VAQAARLTAREILALVLAVVVVAVAPQPIPTKQAAQREPVGQFCITTSTLALIFWVVTNEHLQLANHVDGCAASA